MAPNQEIILFHYSFSPYSSRIIWYLTLRGIPYYQCMQPLTLPRIDISALGMAYRRIPILSIGRDVYTDTRLILQKLDSLYPSSDLGAHTPDQAALQSLLQKWTMDGGVFGRASQLIPTSMPLLADPKFVRDREDYGGMSWKKEDVERARPEAVAEIRDVFSFFEDGLLADGRQWILGGDRPLLADIEGVWPIHWLVYLKDALPPQFISDKQFPKTFAWIRRFDAHMADAKKKAGKPQTLSGADAVKRVAAGQFVEEDGDVDGNDPLGLEKGQDVIVYPLDTGRSHQDRGRLVKLDRSEVVIQFQTKIGEAEVRMHAPRHGFRIKGVSSNASKL